MLTPINGHLLIEPLKQEGFMASQSDSYEEIGVVVSIDKMLTGTYALQPCYVNVGDKIYFDSWLAAKYPKPGTTEEFWWLVKYDDIRAVEKNAENEVSE